MKSISCALILAVALTAAPASIAGAQSSTTETLSKSDLVPIVVDNGKLEGEVTLSVDLDARGSVINTRLISGPELLLSPADGVTRMFNHPRLAGIRGATQQVYFWKQKPGMQKTPPVYPPAARTAKISGIVQVIASVAVDGEVSQVVLLSGHPLLTQSAINAVKQWIYPQVQVNGNPEPYHVIIDVPFKL